MNSSGFDLITINKNISLGTHSQYIVIGVYLEQIYFLRIDLKDLKLNKEGSEGRKTLVVRNLIRHS